MIVVRPAAERGHANHGWLDSHFSFSFADYHDPRHMGFGALRVINDDRIAAGAGFPTHAHRDMEIVTYVLEGAVAHRDSMGTGAIVRPGEVQRMSAGTGVSHSEFNASKTEPLHLLQIWIVPERRGLTPSYEQKAFSADDKRGTLRLMASRDGRDGSVTIQQDVRVLGGTFDGDQRARLELSPGRRAWVHVARGEVEVNGKRLVDGDGAAFTAEPAIEVARGNHAELLVFDLA